MKLKNTYILVLIAFLFSNCTNSENSEITLQLESKVDSYNDSTFISYGYIFPGFEDGYIVSDIKNGFLGLIDENFSNLQKIGFNGKGGGVNEFRFLPGKIYQKSNNIYTIEKTISNQIRLRSFNVNTHSWSTKILNGLNDRIYTYNFCEAKDENIVFKSLPTDSSMFVIYNLKTEHTSYILKGQSSFLPKNKIPSFTIINDSLLAVLYDINPRIEIYSITTGLLKTSFDVPLNNKIREILRQYPEAPIFAGDIFSFDNRLFISYNGVGMIDCKISKNGRNIKWTFLNFPDTNEDFLALHNFIVTQKHIIFFTQGEFKVLKTPYS